MSLTPFQPSRRELLALLTPALAKGTPVSNSIGMQMVAIPAGSFEMGETNSLPDELLEPLCYPSRPDLQRRYPHGDPKRFAIPFEHARHGDFDEHPVHRVTIAKAFHMSATQVTNAQYEQFDPAHRKLRGKRGFSKEDDEAVVFVSWHEATAFCEWLSKKENKPYRLPTEAEWEYAARAGTKTPFWTGAALPASMMKNARSTEFRAAEDIVPLTVAKSPANPWGLFDMHGNVEEWTSDWYGPYVAGAQSDPVGRIDGDFKVTRGGSHGTDPFYLRSANRAAALPDIRCWNIGLRVVLGEAPVTKPLPSPARQRYQLNVSQRTAVAGKPSDTPFFKGPRRFVKIPAGSHGPIFSHHNHDMGIAECQNGDLLAIWYTCEQERGREVAIACGRLRLGAQEWEEASLFWDTPDRNDHCPALWHDGGETLYHFNGLGVAGRWEPLAIVMRTSKDNGVTWSKAQLVAPEFGYRNMVGQPVLKMKNGAMLFGADAGSGSTIWVSQDAGKTWSDPGGNIRGIHAAIAEMTDGGLVAMGRGQDIGYWMPRSVSHDLGTTWTSTASTLPPIGGGQRATMIRLKEGPLFLASFATDVEHPQPAKGRADIRPLTKLFGALSFDDGKTWPVRRVITDGLPEHGAESIDGAPIRMSLNSSEPQGYLAASQARDHTIHLISSISHYAFNIAWLKQETPAADGAPKSRTLPTKRQLPQRPQGYALPNGHRTTERSGSANDFDCRRGFTVEVQLEAGELEISARGSALLSHHYLLRVNADGVFYGDEKIAAAGPGVYRMAVRDDTAVQIYCGSTLLAVRPAVMTVNWQLAARGSYIEWTGASSVALDPSGACQPYLLNARM